MPTDQIERDGIEWVEIGYAARLSRTKAVLIRKDIEAGKIAVLVEDGRTYIPFSAAWRLKREAATMAKVKRLNKQSKPPPAHNYGVLAKEKQQPLPMSSGRGGRGWLGQKPK